MSDTLSLAQALIACPSVTPQDAGCQDLLAARLATLGFEVTSYPIGETKNLWAQRGKGEPSLCFAGHTDVVPAGDLKAWHSSPFVPTLQEGHLYGRGAADMKSSLAAMVTACERFIKTDSHHKGSLSFLITSDEEGPALDGTQAVLNTLVEKGMPLPQWCLVGEASSTQKVGDVIKIGRRGSITGHLTVNGKQGHIAYPQLAKNPIHLMVPILEKILALSWGQAIPPFPPTGLQFSNLYSGTGAANVIPGVLEAVFNLRFSPQWNPTAIEQKIEDLLQSCNTEYALKWTVGALPFYTQPTHPFVQCVSQVIARELGYKPAHSTDGGTSDGRFFAQHGCAVVELGPCNATVHQANECINIADLETLTHLYEKILHAVLV